MTLKHQMFGMSPTASDTLKASHFQSQPIHSLLNSIVLDNPEPEDTYTTGSVRGPPTAAEMMQPIPSPRYHELRTDAERDDDKNRYAAEDKAESFFEDEEKAWSDITAGDPGVTQRKVSRRRRMWTALMSVRSLLDTVLLLIILGLLLERGWQRTPWFEFGGDITGFAPRSMDPFLTRNCHCC
jgi:hypothetical protein